MADEKLMGLAELIEQVKQELIANSPDNDKDIPLLNVDSVELELQVTIKKQGKGGFKIYVLELGGGGSRDNVQRVKVKLSTLFDKQQLLTIYKKKYPERWRELLETSLEVMKGSEDPGI